MMKLIDFPYVNSNPHRSYPNVCSSSFQFKGYKNKGPLPNSLIGILKENFKQCFVEKVSPLARPDSDFKNYYTSKPQLSQLAHKEDTKSDCFFLRNMKNKCASIDKRALNYQGDGLHKMNLFGTRKSDSIRILPMIKARGTVGLLPAAKNCRNNKCLTDDDKEIFGSEDIQSKNTIDDYIVGSPLGRGAYAIVRQGIHKITGKRVAIKIYKKQAINSFQKKSCIKREMRILKFVDHPNIVKLYDLIETPKEVFIIMEFVKGRSLLNYLKGRPGKKLDEQECASIFKSLLGAIAYCHKNGIIHRDIKLENVILDEDLTVKIIDFGFSTWFKPMQKLRSVCGTPSYMAPELVAKKEHDGPASDMWALGVLLYVTLCGEFPFQGNSEKEIYRRIMKGMYEVPTLVSIAGRRLINHLLKFNPERRPTAEEVLRDSFFNNAE